MDYIKIEGYKSIKAATIELAPINILIGANGSGKSNFISFFDFLNRLYNRKLNNYIALNGGDNKFLHNGKKQTDSISFLIEFNSGKNGYSAKLKSGTEGFVFVEERLIQDSDIGVNISTSNNEARIKTTDDLRAKHIINYLDGFRKYHFHDTSMNSPFTQSSHVENDSYYLYDDGKNLGAFLYNIQNEHKIVYNLIIKNIQSIAPYFSDFYFNPNAEKFIRLQWTDKFNDVIFGATDFSDGTLRFIALTTLFLQPNLPDTIIIDEPELGLHPAAIGKLAGMIKSVADKGCQVIIATQSSDLISHFLPEDIITVDQIKGESVFKSLNQEMLKKWLDDYTIDDLWKRNIINGGQPNFS